MKENKENILKCYECGCECEDPIQFDSISFVYKGECLSIDADLDKNDPDEEITEQQFCCLSHLTDWIKKTVGQKIREKNNAQ